MGWSETGRITFLRIRPNIAPAASVCRFFRHRGSGDRRPRLRRPQCVFENPLPNAFALDIARAYRGREVNPAKDTGRTIFLRCFREAPELAGDARVGCAARHRETD